MAQINLLKQKTPSETLWEFLPGLFAKLMIGVVIVVFGYYGWLFFKGQSLDNAMKAAQVQVATSQQQADQVLNREEVYTRQSQLKQLNDLVNKHLYWSYLLPALAKITLNNAAYNNLQATKDGAITVTVTVPDLQSIDKFLQVFDMPEYTKNFNSLKMGAFHTVQSGNQTAYSFEAHFNFNQSLLHYEGASSTPTPTPAVAAPVVSSGSTAMPSLPLATSTPSSTPPTNSSTTPPTKFPVTR